MRRHIAAFITFLLLVTALSGCAKSEQTEKSAISIICTVFPQYDWTRQILGSKAGDVDLTILLNNRIDMHSYQPSVQDITKISTCDLFIYVGGESDKWVGDALKQAVNSAMVVINLLDILGDAAKTEEIVEGMEEDAAEDDEDDEDEEFDEHVWLSLKNAVIFCSHIAQALSSLDPENAAEYMENTTAYIRKINALDEEYQTMANAAPVKTLLFGDRFPFRYLVDDYGIAYHAAFPGCSAETEASFDTIIYLARKTDELDLRAILVTESSDQSIANTIINNTAAKDQRIFTLDSMQSVTLSGADSGVTYLSIMEENLNTLAQALQ